MQALAWLAEDTDLVNGFLAASGVAPADLSQVASRPEMLAAVLDFVLEDEARVLAFCAATGVRPAEPMAARAALPGGDVPHWT